MAGVRLSYEEFRNSFLLQLAIITGGDFDLPVSIQEVAATLDGKFPASWVEAGVGKLYVAKLVQFADPSKGRPPISLEHLPSVSDLLRELGAERDNRHYVTITERGLEEAEDVARASGVSLWEQIDEFEADPRGGHLAEAGRIIPINRESAEYIAVKEGVDSAIRAARSDNELMATSEGSQRIAELEAGKTLMSADQVNESLVKRTLIPALYWVGKKVRDEATGTAVRLIVTKLLGLL